MRDEENPTGEKAIYGAECARTVGLITRLTALSSRSEGSQFCYCEGQVGMEVNGLNT